MILMGAVSNMNILYIYYIYILYPHTYKLERVRGSEVEVQT